MNYFALVRSLRTFTRQQQQPWNGLCPATGCVPLGGSAAGAQGGDHV
ncbi:hypothetical protein [Paracidovorax avenae]|nr:hypothetical protein [Paracidovorax avenae]